MEQSISIYDKLLELPLFQGHSREDLTSILTKIKVDFRNYRKGQIISEQDDPCKNIIFLMEGEVSLERTSRHKDLLFIEQFKAPHSFGTETLFGLRQNYSHTITAQSDVKTLIVSKYSIITHLFDFEVFRYNMLNMLTTRIQRTQQLLWAPEEESIIHNFIQLCKKNFTHPAGPKSIEGGMVSLARMMNCPRIQISHMLNTLSEKKLITLSRKKILIPQLEKLIQSS